MDFTRAELKSQAKEQMTGKIGGLILCFIVMTAVSGVAGVIPFVGTIAAFILTPVITVGWVKICLNVTYGDDPEVGTLFEAFQTDFGRALGTFWLMSLFIMLWSLLFVIPGIIMAYAYSQSFRIMLENPDLSPSECLKASKEMMVGRKLDLFVLHLSFIPWFLLVMITFGLASLYVVPYYNITETNFYHRVKKGGDGTDVYNAPEGTVFNSVENVAGQFTDALDSFSDKVEDAADSVIGKIDDKLN